MKTRSSQDAVRKRLEEIAARSGGRLTPQAVVMDATDPKSPLHTHFEWDVDKAAQRHWLDQARTLIRSVEVVVRTDRIVIRAPYFVRDPNAAAGEQGYLAITRVRKESDLAREVVVNEFSRAADSLRRAHAVARALEIEDDVKEILDGVVELQQRMAAAS